LSSEYGNSKDKGQTHHEYAIDVIGSISSIPFSRSSSMITIFAPIISFLLTCITHTFVSAPEVKRRMDGENINLVIITDPASVV
jgi:hypothetical protein